METENKTVPKLSLGLILAPFWSGNFKKLTQKRKTK
jgi:hypothetical protein